MRPSTLFAAVAVAVLPPLTANAQSAADSVPLTARMMVIGTATVRQSRWSQAGIIRSSALEASARPFVTDHWQLGVTPTYDRVDGPTTGQWGGVALLADWGTPIPGGLRAYVGGYASSASASSARTFFRYGWHAGVMRFLSPAAALRAELRDYAGSAPMAIAPERSLVLALEQYYVRGAPAETSVPTLGSVDVDGIAALYRDPLREGSVDIGVAPFVGRWLQFGGRVHASKFYGLGSGAHNYDGFLRLYWPISPALEPFVGGNLESSTWGSDAGGLSYVDGFVGARHSLQRSMAVDGGVQLRTNRPQQGLPRSPNELTVFGRLVLTADWRRAE